MTIPLRLPGVGVTVAVGLPKIVRSVLPEIMTVSPDAKLVAITIQSPVTARRGDPVRESVELWDFRENKRLRQQLKRAELEREILKKATAHFAKESL